MANFNFSARYVAPNSIMCFKHAVEAAILGIDINVEIDEFGQDGDLRQTWCDTCAKELDKET